MSELPKTQKAVIFNTNTTQLSLSTTAPVPTGPPEEHIIKVHSTAITNGELTWGPFVNWPVEHVPGFDVSGTIVTTVPGSKFQVGDKVYGRIGAAREGAARQYATILPSETALVPEGLDMVDAASVPMSAHTAWQALFEKGLITGSFSPSSVPHVGKDGNFVGDQAKGKRVLVLGAAGGVGFLAVQFGKLAGATVFGTASARNRELLEGLGIDGVIDYNKTSMKDWISGDEEKKFDLVFDCVGGKSMLDGWNAVKENGVYVSVVVGFKEPDEGKPAGVKSIWFIMDARGPELEAIGKIIAKGLITTSVDSIWAIEEYENAFKKTATGHAKGKVVIKVTDN
ncbi:NAD(P)-binding protein [Aaosphaeria arxii CBS 175.79]|uniref:NAD(P)-binding protein n=1 Tax=Aaosphaeria arxii CBS 175.79 TaxID=1450172 RepID=A0A6A5XEV5_9PLEO|nr:NAD(P)-binding protein [Aaosphaeria arxii CBS 175.79]KAF2011389.1 NAD(P)-binding protein [Aaosphaeria arxii CBS 175.79]